MVINSYNLELLNIIYSLAGLIIILVIVMVNMFSRWHDRRRALLSLVFYTSNVKNIKKSKKISDNLKRRIEIAETYIVYYGLEKPRGILSIPLYVVKTPFSRGEALLAGIRISISNILALVNLDSKCFSIDIIEKSLEKILDGEIILSLSSPLTNERLSEIYRKYLHEISSLVPMAVNIPYPSYSFIVILKRFIVDVPHSYWNIEHFASLRIASQSSRNIVVDNKCIDNVDSIRGYEEYIIRDLIRKLLVYASTINLVEKDKVDSYLEKLGVRV